MPVISSGVGVSERLTFNSGYLDFGNSSDGYKRLVDVESISVDVSFAEKEVRRLNSIKIAAHKRATLKVNLKAKTRSVNWEILLNVMGTDTVEASGRTVSIYNGQIATANNPVFTSYVDDDVAKPIQFQLTDAIIVSSPTTSNLEDFGTMDLELFARDIKIYTVSTSPSKSPSASPSVSPSVSKSPSASPSKSTSKSPSKSPSVSPSVSPSP
jgi:hypothetical protein